MANLKERTERTESQMSLLLRKEAYPYDYVDSPDKLQETRRLPLLTFDNVLTGESITYEDYTHAK